MSRPTATRTAGGVLAGAAVLLVALNLRAPIVGVSSVLGTMRAELGMSAAVAGLLTSLPVLCFAVASPPASWMLARLGLERAVLAALVVIGVGTVVRSVDGVPAALAGTVLIGLGITVGNVAVPMVIGRDFPRRSSAMLGAYTAALNIGSMITLSFTVPLMNGVGWRWALIAWVGLVVVAMVAWGLAGRARTAGGDARDTSAQEATAPAADTTDWWRRPVVWGLTLAFAGQAFAYYGLTAWLPQLLTDLRGLTAAEAGTGSSIFQIAALVGAVAIPVVRARTDSLRAAFALVAVTWLALPLGLLLAPGGWALWCACGGAAQGGGFTVIFSAMLSRSRDLKENRRMSTLVQGGGYAVAAAGPSVVGAVHDATAGWTAPLIIVLASLTVLVVAGMAATRRIRSSAAVT